MKILILCTGNSCRSQMAQAYLRQFGPELEVHSAGTEPALSVHPKAVRVMQEENIDISLNRPAHVNDYLDQDFDYVITVCDGAKENCPVFGGQVKHRLHLGFEDPAAAMGSEDEIMATFRRVRDQIKTSFSAFHQKHFAENQ